METLIDGRSPTKQASMAYGTDVRYIRSVICGVQNANRSGQKDAFTKDDIDLITIICNDAEKRAKDKYDAIRREIDTTATHSDLGSSTESREYSGK